MKNKYQKNILVTMLMGVLSSITVFSQSTFADNNWSAPRFLGYNGTNGANPLEIKVNGITRMHFNGTGTGYGVNTWGFIGVGTSSPASPLHVVGSQQQNAQGWMRGITLSNSASLIWDGIGGSSFFMTHPSGTPNGNWFAGSQTSLNSSATVDYAFTVFVNNTLGTNPLRSTMFYKNLLVYEDAFERRFGVNTINPTRAAEIKSNLNQAPQLRLTTTNNNWSDLETNSNGNLLLRPMSQRVGINLTTNPTANLDVNGDVRIRNVQAATPNSILIGVNANGSSDVNVRRLDFNGNANTVLSGNGTWVAMNTNTNSGPGNYCGAGVPPLYLPNGLTANYQMELAGKNYYFTESTTQVVNPPANANRVGFGYNCSSLLPGKVSIKEFHSNSVNQNTIAIDIQNKDVAGVLPLTFTGVKALVDGVETLPRIEHIAGDFISRNGQLNYGIRSLINTNQFVGSTDYGAFIEVNDPNALVTFGSWSTGQGGSNSNWGVYASAAPRSANLGGSSIGYGGRFGSANHFTRNIGVWGVALDPFPTQNHQLSSCFGAAGIAQNGASNYGVYGEAGLTGINNAGYFTGNVQLTGTPLVVSDAQFKTNVETLSNGLDILIRLKPKTYFMDSVNFERMNFDRTLQYGFIAQDVAQILPSLVKSNIHPAVLDSNGVELYPSINYQSLNYNAIIPINSKAIIELNQKVDRSTLSDLSTKVNVQDLYGSLDKVLNMRGVSFDWNHNNYPEFNFDSTNHVGFIAQEIAQIDDRLTYIADDSLLHVEYDKVVPILVEAIQELNDSISLRDSVISLLVSQNEIQQETIDDLNIRLSNLESCLSGILPFLCQLSQQKIELNSNSQQEEVRAQLSVLLANKEAVILDQNVPNPFVEKTVINFSIPETVQKAQIHFYDGNGKIMQSVDIIDRGLGSLTVFGADLSAGVYTYTLVADGIIVATKRMLKE